MTQFKRANVTEHITSKCQFAAFVYTSASVATNSTISRTSQILLGFHISCQMLAAYDLDRTISNTHFRLTKDMMNIHSPVYIEVSYSP